MKVILTDNIRAVGKVGDIKEVRDGYARNFLLRRNLARVATDGVVRDVEQMKAKKLAAYDVAQEQAQAMADKLKDTSIELKATANEKGMLFAAIKAEQISAALSTESGAHIDPAHVILSEPIKMVGEHSVLVDLTEQVSVTVNIKVVAA